MRHYSIIKMVNRGKHADTHRSIIGLPNGSSDTALTAALTVDGTLVLEAVRQAFWSLTKDRTNDSASRGIMLIWEW